MADQIPQPQTETADTRANTDRRAPEPSQDELRRRYVEQQRRMRCVGCGEGEEYF